MEASPRLRERVNLMKSRTSDGSTTAVQRFRSGDLEPVTAGAFKCLQMRTARVVVAEKVSQYETDEDGNVGVGAIPSPRAR